MLVERHGERDRRLLVSGLHASIWHDENQHPGNPGTVGSRLARMVGRECAAENTGGRAGQWADDHHEEGQHEDECEQYAADSAGHCACEQS
jgi:hypothetical protein